MDATEAYTVTKDAEDGMWYVVEVETGELVDAYTIRREAVASARAYGEQDALEQEEIEGREERDELEEEQEEEAHARETLYDAITTKLGGMSAGQLRTLLASL